MGKNIINIALFGLGRIGQMHAENLINHPEFNLKYVFDIDKKLTKKLSKKYQSIPIKNPSIALKDKNIKSIFISTSTKTHLKFIEEAVKNKKIVFCEKPLDLNLKKINQCKKNIANLIKYPDKPIKYDPDISYHSTREYVFTKPENPITYPKKLLKYNFKHQDTFFYNFHAMPPLILQLYLFLIITKN